jgi:ElaB/YqjD/DUF883 family membrane-anchored ribosome-binding protein
VNLQINLHADPAALERDIHQTRAHVDRVLDALQVKLSPRQLQAQARRFLKERSAQAAQRLERSVRDNPWPYVVGLIGAVALVALLGEGRARAERRAASIDRAP